PTTALRLGQNFDAFHVMTRLTDRHKTIPYFKRVLVSSDTWGRSTGVIVATAGFVIACLIFQKLANKFNNNKGETA
ncbi:hypothetical protein, partial [Burkholderia multivorans]|uniref:hypothetical protein n=1 Tax=Burkholderia multivorans TaxID=87883 RepID=UPI001C613652